MEFFYYLTKNMITILRDTALEGENDTQKNIDIIQNSAGFQILQKLPSNLSSISYQFEASEIVEEISFEEFLSKYSINKNDFQSLKTENVWENSLFEIYKTHNFLRARLYKAENKLRENWFELSDLMEALIQRLVTQIIEAWNWQRKLKNGTVVWLSRYSNEWYTFAKVPYYAFACANVSLDIVKIRNTNWNEYSLRELDNMLDSRNDENWLLLPNSIWVSACLMTKNEKWDIVFIAQERNNATTLSQNVNKFIASASWGVPVSIFDKHRNLWALNDAMWDEVREELWVSPIHSLLTQDEVKWLVRQHVAQILSWKEQYIKISILWETLNNEWKKILWRELWLDANLLPVALVFKELRRNPEFIFIWKVWLTLEEVIEHWKNAEDKDESLSVRWFTLDEIQEELERRKDWYEKQIDDHFFMSFLWYLMTISK